MQKLIIYQLLPRLFGNRNASPIPNATIAENGSGRFADIDLKALRRIKALGANAVWYTGVVRHATTTDYTAYGIPQQHPSIVKGKAGSPYAITDYYDVNPDLATDVNKRMEEFEELIARTHSLGMKVVMDFVPNHVARQYRSIKKPAGVQDLGFDDNTNWHFSPQNNFYYCPSQPFQVPATPSVPSDSVAGPSSGYRENPARATGNDHFSPAPSRNDWYETIKLNYGIDYNDWSGRPSCHFSPTPSTWLKMTDILLFWASKGVDFFRCDMAEMVPSAFWRYATGKLHERYPDVKLIGEVYNPQLYREYIAAGFDYLYDKVGMYDTLRAIIADHHSTAAITAQWQQVDDIRSHMLYFLENHDEQRIASSFFAADARKAIPALIISALLYSNPLMIYFGQEFGERGMDAEGFSGQDGRTTIFDYWTVDSVRRGFFDRRRLTAEEKALEADYKKILGIAREKTVSEGLSFDLMYVNPQLQPDQYAFIRSTGGKENLLVAVNFCDYQVEISLVIPNHAFNFLSLPQGEVKAVDLMNSGTDETTVLSLFPDQPMALTIPANSAVVLKF